MGIINSGENDEKEDKCGKEHRKKVLREISKHDVPLSRQFELKS